MILAFVQIIEMKTASPAQAEALVDEGRAQTAGKRVKEGRATWDEKLPIAGTSRARAVAR